MKNDLTQMLALFRMLSDEFHREKPGWIGSLYRRRPYEIRCRHLIGTMSSHAAVFLAWAIKVQSGAAVEPKYGQAMEAA